MRILPAFLLMSAPALAVTPFDSGNACTYGGKFVTDREVDSPWSIRIPWTVRQAERAYSRRIIWATLLPS